MSLLPKPRTEKAADRPLGHNVEATMAISPKEEAIEYIEGIHNKNWNGDMAYARFYSMSKKSYKHLRTIDINRTLALIRRVGKNTHLSRKPTPTSNTLLQMTNVYEASIRAGIVPDQYTYQELIAINTDLMNFDRAHTLLEEMVQRGVKLTIRPYRTLLKGYSMVASEIDNARRLWQSIKAKISSNTIATAKSTDQTIKLDLLTYTCIVAAECNEGDFARVMDILEEMDGAGIAADIVLRNTVLGGIIKHRGLDSGIKEVKLMVDSGFIPDSYTYYLLIQSAVSEGRIDDMKRLLAESAKRGITPSVKLIRKLQLSPQEILDTVTRNGVGIDMVRVYNPLIGLTMRENSFNEALGLIGHMRAHKIEPNTVTYSYLLDALSKSKRLNEAKAIYKEAFGPNSKLVPDAHILGIMIDACARAGDIHGLFWHKKEMEHCGLAPTEVIYNIILSALSRWQQGNLEAIILTMDELMEANPPIQPSTRTLNAVYAAFAAKAARAGWLEPNELQCLRMWYKKSHSVDLYIPRDMYTYTLVIEAFASSNYLEDALFVYSDMLNHGENDASVLRNFTRSPKCMSKLILACVKNQQYTKVLELWGDWRQLGIPGHEESLRMVLFACDQLGRSTSARNIVFGLLTPQSPNAGVNEVGATAKSKSGRAHLDITDDSDALKVEPGEDDSLAHGYQPDIVSGAVLALFIGIAIKHRMVDCIMPALNLWHPKTTLVSRPMLSIADAGGSQTTSQSDKQRLSSDDVAQILALLQKDKSQEASVIISDFLTFVEDNFPEAAPV
ncbi:hypothetical protein IW140_001704 [Coemansia sp. RSA 1813]|nr:hypothetical protein LPJ74_001420 [Coemansia sp. RSA 1843]KAJ2571250.1 hypothetical protein IW140_001704 [Coemansia sp. RSA 1813]